MLWYCATVNIKDKLRYGTVSYKSKYKFVMILNLKNKVLVLKTPGI
jgi:hypothetical protein